MTRSIAILKTIVLSALLIASTFFCLMTVLGALASQLTLDHQGMIIFASGSVVISVAVGALLSFALQRFFGAVATPVPFLVCLPSAIYTATFLMRENSAIALNLVYVICFAVAIPLSAIVVQRIRDAP